MNKFEEVEHNSPEQNDSASEASKGRAEGSIGARPEAPRVDRPQDREPETVEQKWGRFLIETGNPFMNASEVDPMKMSSQEHLSRMRQMNEAFLAYPGFNEPDKVEQLSISGDIKLDAENLFRLVGANEALRRIEENADPKKLLEEFRDRIDQVIRSDETSRKRGSAYALVTIRRMVHRVLEGSSGK